MSELARMAQEAQRQYEAGETEEGGFASDEDTLDAELLKQLTRIADALEAQNRWHADVWFPYTQKCREEDTERRQTSLQHQLSQEKLDRERAFKMTELFVNEHPEMVATIMQAEQQAEAMLENEE